MLNNTVRSDLDVEELDILERALQKTIAPQEEC